MKRHLTLLLCAFTFIAASAFRYVHPHEIKWAAVYTDKMNVFYVGVDNPITIAVADMPPSEVLVKVSNGTVTSGLYTTGRFIVHVANGTETRVNLSYMQDSVEHSLGTFNYRVKRVPDPVCYAGPAHGLYYMDRSELATLKGIFARMVNFDFDLSFKVVSFDLTMLADGKYTTLSAGGPAFTPEMTKVLAVAKSGDRFFFENVKVSGAGEEKPRAISGVTIVVK